MTMDLYRVRGIISWSDQGRCCECLKAEDCLRLDCDYSEDGLTSVDVLILAESLNEAIEVALEQEIFKGEHSYGRWVGAPIAGKLSEADRTRYLESPENFRF